LNDVLFRFAGKLASENIEVSCRCRQISLVIGHHDELTQLFANLVANAIDAIRDQGRIILAVRAITDLPHKTLGVAISVIDNGSSISQEMKDKICKPFFSTKEANGVTV
jgi:signal transduction histidine kinase